MPANTRSSRAGLSAHPPTVRFSAPPTKKSSRVSKRWRTSGIVDKQSTLTQIDFVRRPEITKYEDLDLDYEDDTTLIEPKFEERRPKKRKLDIGLVDDDESSRTRSTKQSTTTRFTDDEENDVFEIPAKEPELPTISFRTPQKPTTREIPSSQSPTTPWSARSPKNRSQHAISPLKEVSVNIRRPPRLIAEDTYKTNYQLSSSPSIGSRHSQTRSLEVQDQNTDRSEGVLSRRKIKITKLEISDSDEDSSDLDITSSPLVDGRLAFDDTTLLDVELPTQEEIPEENGPNPTPSEVEIMRPPISDDSRIESQDRRKSAAAHLSSDKGEINTLEDTALARPKRTYSGRRQFSLADEIPSSSSLEELPELTSRGTASSANQLLELPSSPPVRSRSQSQQTDRAMQKSSQPEPQQALQRSSSPPQHNPRIDPTDSQQAITQLQQESQWRPPIMPPSQASTASIQSSPVREEVRKTTQSGSSRRGWFFNPLTDSQLLPDSIMNFEIPHFVSGRAAAVPDDLEEQV